MRISDWSSDVCSPDLPSDLLAQWRDSEAEGLVEALAALEVLRRNEGPQRHHARHKGVRCHARVLSEGQRLQHQLHTFVAGLEPQRLVKAPRVGPRLVGGKLGRASCRERVCQYV